MNIFIRSASGVSPQPLYNGSVLLPAIIDHRGNRFTCEEPDYSNIIDVKLMRRMSRIIKMGVAAATQCLKEASLQMPDAIITGTAYGCLQDTESFLTRLVEFKEELLTPTAFIQSTHNTAGAQIALMLKCYNYNNTYVHKGFSFESALLDAVMMLQENEITNALVGGLDEITDTSHAILLRFNLYKEKNIAGDALYTTGTKGTVAGEGAVFFVLTNKTNDDNIAKLDAVTTFYKPGDFSAIQKQIVSFLSDASLATDDIDVVITGKNGDEKNDAVYEALQASIFENNVVINFKHLCGEYPVASSFALWLGASIIKENKVPPVLMQKENKTKQVKRVLICNNYQNIYHSLFLLSAC